jgi:hypothetical protein
MVVDKTEVVLVAVCIDINRTKLNTTEDSIADQLDRRKVMEEKRDASNVVVRSAHDARNALLAILEHLCG